MDTYVTGLVCISLTTVAAVAGMLAVRRWVGFENLATYHEVAGYLFSIIGTLYAVLLGFVVVDSMNHLQEVRITVEQEANALMNVYFAADGLDVKVKDQLQSQARRYANVVIDEEWATMKTGQPSDNAFHCMWLMWHTASHFDPKTEREQNIQQTLLGELSQLGSNRRIRLVTSLHELSPVMWTILILGGSLTIVFTYFFGVENVRAQILMVALVSVTLGLNIFLVFLFGYPFSGVMGVRPDAFKLDLGIMNGYSKFTAERFQHLPGITGGDSVSMPFSSGTSTDKPGQR